MDEVVGVVDDFTDYDPNVSALDYALMAGSIKQPLGDNTSEDMLN
jgi:hypothetical protein